MAAAKALILSDLNHCGAAFFAMCFTKGCADYQRSMYYFLVLVRYWIAQDLPVRKLLELNHTLFSEEAGEIALSVLVNAQPANCHGDLEHIRRLWQLFKMRYNALREADRRRHAEKKFRVIRKSSSVQIYSLGNMDIRLVLFQANFSSIFPKNTFGFVNSYFCCCL
jgi:hypothetical protein